MRSVSARLLSPRQSSICAAFGRACTASCACRLRRLERGWKFYVLVLRDVDGRPILLLEGGTRRGRNCFSFDFCKEQIGLVKPLSHEWNQLKQFLYHYLKIRSEGNHKGDTRDEQRTTKK